MSIAALSRALPFRAGRLGRAAAAALLTSALSVPAGAQVTLRVTGAQSGAPSVSVATQQATFGPSANWTWGGGTVTGTSSPYLATASVYGTPLAITVICVDLMSTATFNETYAINLSSLASAATTLLDTRWVTGMKQQTGGSTASPTFQTLTNADAMTRYRMASYLGSYMEASNKSDWNDIQLAIWEIMTPFAVRNDVSAWTSTSAASWLAQAQSAAAGGFVGVDFSNAYVLTDATVDDAVPELQGARAHLGRQEFVTAASRSAVVPEPSTYLLLGTGLAALGLVARRRRDA